MIMANAKTYTTTYPVRKETKCTSKEPWVEDGKNQYTNTEQCNVNTDNKVLHCPTVWFKSFVLKNEIEIIPL